ncbi:DUF4340 domain-containing protein [Tahibacter sp.]|uniref:DUF4340 domain-containing protein n=1 Tax=Tahibacter sp. TaxID=2056211 RepID=UPI0028C44E93|nr:DUF4340 domain-containing protein [Tahibacter sp.]
MNHMNSKTVIVLGVAAAVAIAIAAGITLSRKPVAQTAQAASEVLPGLADHVNDVTRISLSGPGQKPIATLEKSDTRWTLKEKGGYPADTGKVREYLLKLSQARLSEPKTTNEQRYAGIGVGDIADADAKGMLVVLDGLPQPAQLIVGIMNPRSDATYVRRAGDKQSWLARGSLVPDKTAANWLDKRVADIPATRVREVVWSRPDGKPVRLFKSQPSDTNYALAELPKGRELAADFATNTQATVLAGLNFDDVVAAAEAPPPADGKVYRATFTSFDGLVVDVTGWKKDEKFHAQFAARKDAVLFDASVAAAQAKARSEWEAQQAAQPAAPDNAARPAAATPPLAVADPAKDKAQRGADIDAEVATLSQRFAGWTFVLPQHKAANLEKSSDEFLKPLADTKSEARKPAAAK